jgi:hypothetical protein
MRVRAAKQEDVAALIYRGLREVDVKECYRSTGRGPNAALWDGFLYSDICFVGEHDGEVFAMGGVLSKSAMNPGGIVWLLGTDKLEDVWYSFAKESKRLADLLLDEYGSLENLVDASNKKTIRWLKWLGFSFDDTVMTPFGHPFKRFWRKNV